LFLKRIFRLCGEYLIDMAEKSVEPKAQESRESTKRLLMHWLDLGTLSQENKKLREVLYDEVTKLPTISLLLGQIKSLLQIHKQIGLLYVDVARDSKIEQIFGWRVFDEIMHYVGQSLEQLKGTALRTGDIVSSIVKSGNAFVVLLSPPRNKPILEMDDLLKIRKRLNKDLVGTLKQFVDPSLSRRFRCNIGCAIVEEEPEIRVERLVFNALEAAKENAQLKELEHKERQVEELRQIINQGEINTLFQPIVNLSTGQTLIYEALSRGPRGEMEGPERLFRIATEGDLVWKLDRLCREKALLKAKGIKKYAELLAINVDPRAIGDPKFKEISESSFLTACELPPERIILEISEKAMIADSDLYRLVLDYFKALGFLIAIDDAGSGFYAGLELIAKLKPNFVKIDIPLISGCDKDEIKQDLISTISKFASKIGAIVTAEGIETEAELVIVKKLGLNFAQGFLLAYPAEPFPGPNMP